MCEMKLTWPNDFKTSRKKYFAEFGQLLMTLAGLMSAQFDVLQTTNIKDDLTIAACITRCGHKNQQTEMFVTIEIPRVIISLQMRGISER